MIEAWVVGFERNPQVEHFGSLVLSLHDPKTSIQWAYCSTGITATLQTLYPEFTEREEQVTGSARIQQHSLNSIVQQISLEHDQKTGVSCGERSELPRGSNKT